MTMDALQVHSCISCHAKRCDNYQSLIPKTNKQFGMLAKDYHTEMLNH